MNAVDISVQVVERNKKEWFHETVENSDPTLELIINANYGNNTMTDYLAPGPLDPTQDIEGQVIDKGLLVSGTTGKTEPQKACFSFDPRESDIFKRLFFDVANPPSHSMAGFGGLVPLIIRGTLIDEKNRWYKNFSYQDQGSGRLALARSRDAKYLLVMLQPHGLKPTSLYVADIRNKLFDAEMRDAVLLDGSDSVMMYLRGSWKILQGSQRKSFKDKVTRVGMGFYYKPGASRAIYDIEVE
jgi:hypothetical protein